MNVKIEKERPLEKLRRRTGELFDESIVRNWYLSRAYVLEKLKDIVLSPDSDVSLKVIVEVDGCKGLMLSVVRQVALSAHYPNYIEYDTFGNYVRKNRSVIIIVSHDENIVDELNQEEYLNNLLQYCGYQVNGEESMPQKTCLQIDLDINIVDTVTDRDRRDAISMTYTDISAFLREKDESDIFGIDTRMAVLSGRAYSLGEEIDNLPYEDIHDATRYNRALNVFQYKLLPKEIEKLVTDEWDFNQTKVKNGLSNVFCADRFFSINAGIKELSKKEKNGNSSCWERNEERLSISEHTRWVVEKLILGFRPLDTNERIHYESLFGTQRKEYAKMLKGNPKVREDYAKRLWDNKDSTDNKESLEPTHVNLCTFRELRRIDPDNRKYDSFLMLAIPLIIQKIEEDDKGK